MSLDNALFLVDRGGTNYRSKGSDIGTRIKNGDKVLVQRESDRFTATYGSSSWGNIGDNDLLLAWDGSNTRKVKGSNFKALFISASISSNRTSINTGYTYTISWNCTGGVQYQLRSPSTFYAVAASGSKNFNSSTGGNKTFSIEVLTAGGAVLASDSVTVEVIEPLDATISTNQTSAGEGETYRISWTASGGSSYKLLDSYGNSRYNVSADSYKDFTADSNSGTRYFTIEVYNSSGTKVKTASTSVKQLGSGYKWVYGASVAPGGSGKWSHGDGKTKFHNTDDNGNYVENWWRSFSSGTRRIKLGSTYQDFNFPTPSSIGSGTGKATQFSTLNLTGGMGTEIIIFNK